MGRPKGSQRGTVRRSAGRTAAANGCLFSLVMIPLAFLGALRRKR